MPTVENLDRLEALSKVVPNRPGWQPFAAYLDLRAKGRRAEALRILADFVKDAELWRFAERRRLLVWLDHENDFGWADNMLMPQPLLLRVIVPTASEWLADEPDSAQANCLYAVYAAPMHEGARPIEYLRRAIDLDPANQESRLKLLSWVVGGVSYSQHEVPWHGYLGSASDDISSLRHALAIAEGVDDAGHRSHWKAELSEQLEIAETWAAFEKSRAQEDFATWCAQHGAPASITSRL